MGRRSSIEDVKINQKMRKTVVVGAARVGLQILIHHSDSDSKSCYIVVKSKLKQIEFNSHPNPNPNPNPIPSHDKSIFPLYYSCFLKSCFLCNKTLSLDKDVYMYRGDQGFCSEECRNRQIYVDEIREIETSTKKMLASTRQSLYGGRGRCEASISLEDRRRRHTPLSRSHQHQHQHQPIFS